MPVLYIVATPIGNLADMTLRAIGILKQVDYIAAEDTRHSLPLLQHYGIKAPMLAYHEHSDEAQMEKLLSLLAEGKSVALISDAGTPLISDPGFPLVRRALASGLDVVPVPGASALLAALCASGQPTDAFSFRGFLPAKTVARRDVLSNIAACTETQVFYEAPHRVLETLVDMRDILGAGRTVTLARELTKNFETIRQLPLVHMVDWVAQDANQQRGEIVLVVEGAPRDDGVKVLSAEAGQLVSLLMAELPPKTVSKIVAEHYGLAKKTVYDHILALKK